MGNNKEDCYVVPGFTTNGIHSGIKENGLKDLALIFSAIPSKVSGVFTKNSFKAAPVLLDQERMSSGIAQAILVNSGNANAATGAKGYEDAVAMAKSASRHLHVGEELVLVASTGIIGRRLPLQKIEAGMIHLVNGLNENGVHDAVEAIMTTDKFPKMSCRKGIISTKEITLCGIAKGAGMIEPHMATMLAFLMTDVNIQPSVLNKIFKQAVDESFNAVTVDGCMSTNDTAIIMANGMGNNSAISGVSKDLFVFKEMLFNVTKDLAKSMVRDGEGATKIIEIIVEQAKSKRDAKKVAYAIANSNLVKTAFFGCDPNWGRILSAAGSSGIAIPVDAVELFYDDVSVFANGRAMQGHESELVSVMAKESVKVRLNLGMGKKGFSICTSDLTYDYVRINAHYHT